MGSVDVQTATIRTAQVEIRALTVSGRQVTQSLFKQFPVVPAIRHEDGSINGDPWGRVNFHSDCWAFAAAYSTPLYKSAPHLHIVSQREGSLVHGVTLQQPPSKLIAAIRGEGLRIQRAILLLELLKDGFGRRAGVEFVRRHSGNDVWSVEYGDRHSTLEYAVMAALDQLWFDGNFQPRKDLTSPGYSNAWAFIEKYIDGIYDGLCYVCRAAIKAGGDWHGDILKQRDACHHEEALHLQSDWDASYALLEELPQLFIAV